MPSTNRNYSATPSWNQLLANDVRRDVTSVGSSSSGSSQDSGGMLGSNMKAIDCSDNEQPKNETAGSIMIMCCNSQLLCT